MDMMQVLHYLLIALYVLGMPMSLAIHEKLGSDLLCTGFGVFVALFLWPITVPMQGVYHLTNWILD